MAEGVNIILYIDGTSEHSLLAQDNLQRLCQQHLGKAFEIHVMDVAADPTIAVKEQLVALPTLEIGNHGKRRRLVGDLSLAPKVIAAFGMVEASRRMVDDSRAVLERVKAMVTTTAPATNDGQDPPAS